MQELYLMGVAKAPLWQGPDSEVDQFFVVKTRLILSTYNHGSQVLVTANWRNISQVIVYPLGLIRNNQTLRI